MLKWTRKPSFFEAFGIKKDDVVCLTGAGGKTSLMFRLAAEAKAKGWKILVTTTTRILFPEKNQYDSLSLEAEPPLLPADLKGWVHVAGTTCPDCNKICCMEDDLLKSLRDDFDLVLIEADGSDGKPLKGWKTSEPVIPEFTSKTIGIIDIGSVNRVIDEKLIHRLEHFTKITGGVRGERVSPSHLQKIITDRYGLFQHAKGELILYLNKMESDEDYENGRVLRSLVTTCPTAAGSIRHGRIYL